VTVVLLQTRVLDSYTENVKQTACFYQRNMPSGGAECCVFMAL